MASQTAVAASEPSFIIVGARVADGTGAPLREISVRVAKGRILEIGALTPRVSETVVAGSGFVLAPGFTDIHNHSTSRVLDEPAATSQVSQGITTIVVGQDGSSQLPVSSYFKSLRKTRAAVNVATCVGHATVRRSVMGDAQAAVDSTLREFGTLWPAALRALEDRTVDQLRRQYAVRLVFAGDGDPDPRVFGIMHHRRPTPLPG